MAVRSLPLTYFLRVLRGIILKGVGLEVLWGQMLPLALFGVAVFALSALRFQKRGRRATERLSSARSTCAA